MAIILQAHQSSLPAKSDEDAALEAASVNGESFVVRLFQALHASTLTCPTCKRRSSTFDPYLCVSLPLPQRCPRQLSVVLVPFVEERSSPVTRYSDRDRSLRLVLTLNQYDTVGELKLKLCSELPKLDLKAKKLILVQLREDGFGSTYSNEQPVSDIGEGESLYALEAAFSSETDGATNEEQNGDVRGEDEFDTPMAQVMVVHVEVSPGSNRSYRFGSPAILKVRRDINWKGLQKQILYKMGNTIHGEVLAQKLSAVIRLRVYDGSPRRNSLSSDVEMPLYTQDVERAYETLDEDFGPSHIKLTAEWDLKTKNVIVTDDREYFEEHQSVPEAESNIPGQSRVTLDECFKLYTQEEKLIGEDAWLCPHCKQQQQGTIKTLGLWSLPDVMVLHLKRFKQTGLRRSKLNTLVDFPLEGLDMSPYLARRKGAGGGSSLNESNTLLASHSLQPDDHTYDLLGVSNHYGNMMGGHYIAVCKSPVDGVWREFNDQRVRTLKEGEPIATKEAYLLFYQRRSLGKDINHRLFTGDHWAFSLSLAPSELREEGPSSGGSTPRGEKIPIMPPPSQTLPLRPRQESLTRSVSPSVLKHGAREHTASWTSANSRRSASSSRPLTPQPHRKSIVIYSESRYSDGENGYNYDQSPTSPTRASSPPIRNSASRKSRPVQRQASEPGPRRGKALVSASLDSDKGKDLSLRKSQYDHERDDGLVSNGKPGRRSDVALTAKSYNMIKDKNSSRGPFRHEFQGLSDAVLSLPPRSLGYPSLLQSSSTESNAKHPSSYEYGNYSNQRNISHMLAHELASTLTVKLDDRGPTDLTGHSLSSYSEANTLNALAARRKLAEHIDVDRIEDRPFSSLTLSNRESYGRHHFGRYENQKSYELAQQKPLGWDSDLHTFFSGEPLNGHYPSMDFDKSKAEDQGRWDKTFGDNLNNNNKFMHSNGYSRLDSDVEEEEEGEEADEPVPRSSSQTLLQSKYEHAMKDLAEKHFGPQEKYVSQLPKDDLPPTSSDTSYLQKYASFGKRVADQGKMSAAQFPDRSIPRSSTDHSIQYSWSNSELQAPPSPTPPRGPAEQRNITTSSMLDHGVRASGTSSSFPFSSAFPNSSYRGVRMTGREIQAMQTYEFAGKRGGFDQDSSQNIGVRTLPVYTSRSSVRESRHYFRPPRSTWVKIVVAIPSIFCDPLSFSGAVNLKMINAGTNSHNFSGAVNLKMINAGTNSHNFSGAVNLKMINAGTNSHNFSGAVNLKMINAGTNSHNF
ncbi:hypothetical protein RRG08_009591 [Elysia crispata]|uniref:ubiquitinyl hydrolase 1 n=1 Tax=Elysia crispata TaxID=231223 RepID=A0AAE0XTP7_9GAST|nr:hypothetical protein RRG08_009591 [Elysia crispata]